jgi:hypothetical protein
MGSVVSEAIVDPALATCRTDVDGGRFQLSIRPGVAFTDVLEQVTEPDAPENVAK